MRLVFYDTEHFETLHTLLQIWDTGEHRLELFLPPEMASRLKAMPGFEPARYHWIPFPSGKFAAAPALLQYCRKNKTDLLFLNTVSRHHLFFGLMAGRLKKTVILLGVHDAREFFMAPVQPGIKGWLRHQGIRLLQKKASAFMVLLRSVQQYIIQEFHPPQPVLCIPGSLYEAPALPSSQKDGPLKIIVPGSVDRARRDYEQVLQLAALLEEHSVAAEIRLLGATGNDYAQMLIQRIAALSYPNVTFAWYDTDFLQPAEYEARLAACDIIFLPVPLHFLRAGAPVEEYGRTKSSGAFFDAVRHGKPVFLPDSIPVSPELAEQCFGYASPEALCQHLADAVQLEAAKDAALLNARRFSLGSVRKHLWHDMRDLIQSESSP